MALHSLAEARRARGLPILAGPGRLTRPTAGELRCWRAFVARLTQRQAAELAGVTEAQWAAVECTRAVHAETLDRVLDAWRRGMNGKFSAAADAEAHATGSEA